MHIIVDENVPRVIVKYLREIGHHVLFIAEDPSLRGIKNEELLKLAKKQQAVLLTCDSDFLRYTNIHPIVYLEQLNDPKAMLELVKSKFDKALKKAIKHNTTVAIKREN